ARRGADRGGRLPRVLVVCAPGGGAGPAARAALGDLGLALVLGGARAGLRALRPAAPFARLLRAARGGPVTGAHRPVRVAVRAVRAGGSARPGPLGAAHR